MIIISVILIVLIASGITFYAYKKENKLYYECVERFEKQKNFLLALKNNDASLCKKTNEYDFETCVAMAKGDPKLCPEGLDLCRLAIIKDIKICEKANPMIKTYCEAVVENNPAKCRQIEYEDVAQECLEDLRLGIEYYDKRLIKQRCKTLTKP